MLPDLILHLSLLRQFQLPIELRNIVIETYFPFLNNDRSPFLTQGALLLQQPTHSSQNFHFIPIGNNNPVIQRVGVACSLFLHKKESTIHAMISKGHYIYRKDTSIRFYQHEVLFCGGKIVRLSFFMEDANLEENVQKTICFYRKWVLNAIHGVGYFKTIDWHFYNYLLTLDF